MDAVSSRSVCFRGQPLNCVCVRGGGVERPVTMTQEAPAQTTVDAVGRHSSRVRIVAVPARVWPRADWHLMTGRVEWSASLSGCSVKPTLHHLDLC